MKAKRGSVVGAVLRRLEKKKQPERTKRTLVLTKDTYEKFETLCRGINRYPSEVIDEFIAMYVEEEKG